MNEVHELRLLRRRQFLPVPGSSITACQVLGVAINGGHPGVGYTFSLTTMKRGVEIMMKVPTRFGFFSWSLSSMLDHWPANFNDAREWVHAYAAGYGQPISEDVKPRTPTATGDDRKLLKSGGCLERWLASDIPELYAEAAIRCRHAGGFCMSDGYCHYGSCDMEMTPDVV